MTDENGKRAVAEEAAALEDAPELDAEVLDAEVLDAEVLDADVLDEGTEVPADPADGGSGDAESAAADVDADISELLESTTRERDEYLDLAQRTRADFDNFRKRAANEAATARVRGKTELATDLIVVIDNLERALTAAEVDPSAALAGEVSVDGPLEQGALLTYRELSAALARAGVESFSPTGEPFDPAWHEALQTQSVDGQDAGIVVEVVQKGYRLSDQLIRAARVVVSE